ncbi:MAG TPA: hypothetical protein VGW37_13530 [Terriglobia bacterium]|nr:hypothetical protein [Terriglobia bacterium]
MLWSIFLWAVKLFVAGVLIFYAGMVVIALRTQGNHRRGQLDWHDPAHTAENLLLWVGVKIVRETLRLLRAILDLLEEASADVGEWILHHH